MRSVAFTVALVSVKHVPEYAMKTFALDADNSSASRFGCFSPAVSPLYPLRLGAPQSRSEGFGEDINRFPLPGIELRLLDRPAYSAVTVQTELPRLTLAPLDEVILPLPYLVQKVAVAMCLGTVWLYFSNTGWSYIYFM